MNKEKLNIIVSNNIKKYRKEKQISKVKLSFLTKISISTINDIENNTYKKDISIIMLYKISKVLNIPINNFFEDKNDK